MTSQFILAVVVALLGQTSPVAGSIRGQVVNASRGQAPVPGAEVVLRVKLDGQFVIAAEGIADEQGRFAFDNIPADADYIYLPGANLDGVHYPASRVTLSSQSPDAQVNLAIHDTVADPNPLVVRRHDVTIHPQAGAIRVTEKLLIENPSLRTYVGRPRVPGGRATTLRLSIPSDFVRTTFDTEFYGRQFTLFDGRLVTDIPWTPGQREVSFTYVLPGEGRDRIWQRPLDLPCDCLRIEVHTDASDEIACNVPLAASQAPGVVSFESTGQPLAADHMIRLQLQRPPVSLAAYGRWLALAVLVGLIALTSLIGTCVRRRSATRVGHRQPSTASKRAA